MCTTHTVTRIRRKRARRVNEFHRGLEDLAEPNCTKSDDCLSTGLIGAVRKRYAAFAFYNFVRVPISEILLRVPQIIHERGPNGLEALELPDPDLPVMPGVRWGRYDALFTPAYWRCQTWLSGLIGCGAVTYALGRTLAEEVAACLLGGHGIPAEVGLAAFERLRSLGLLSSDGPAPTHRALVAALGAPLSVSGRTVRYRFVEQKSRYLSEALPRLPDAPLPPSEGSRPTLAHSAHRQLRDWLCTLPGVGPKTASWVTRNWLGSDAVAIIDVHLYRACVLARVFRGTEVVARDYLALESRFLDFAIAIGASAALLDAVMWRDMRWLGPHARARLTDA